MKVTTESTPQWVAVKLQPIDLDERCFLWDLSQAICLAGGECLCSAPYPLDKPYPDPCPTLPDLTLFLPGPAVRAALSQIT